MYLDTSAVRALSGKCDRLISKKIFTSVLTIFELLDGCCASESEYKKRKAALKTIFTAKLAIALEMPDVAVAKSFTEIAANYTIRNPHAETMRRLVYCMLITPTAKEFKPQIYNDPEWNRICSAYDDVVRSSITSASSVGPDLRKGFAIKSCDELSYLRINPELTTDQRFQAFIHGDINRGLSIYVLSQTYSEKLGRGSDVEFCRKIFYSYNGSAEPYIRALSISLLERMERGETPARNDAFDLDHFAYLKPGTVLITNDKRMRTLANKVGVRSVTSEEIARPRAGFIIPSRAQ
jgi:hypothetical protein